jgi:hypothetical protein
MIGLLENSVNLQPSLSIISHDDPCAKCRARSAQRDDASRDHATDEDGVFNTPAHGNRSGPCPPFAAEQDLNAQRTLAGLGSTGFATLEASLAGKWLELLSVRSSKRMMTASLSS